MLDLVISLGTSIFAPAEFKLSEYIQAFIHTQPIHQYHIRRTRSTLSCCTQKCNCIFVIHNIESEQGLSRKFGRVWMSYCLPSPSFASKRVLTELHDISLILCWNWVSILYGSDSLQVEKFGPKWITSCLSI